MKKDKAVRVDESVNIGDQVDFYINGAWEEGIVIRKYIE